jgi:syntaxin 16
MEMESLTKNSDLEAARDLKGVPPAWMRLVDETNFDIDRIKSKIKELAKMHKEHLLPGFDDRVDEEQCIEILTGEITQIFHKCQQRVTRLGKIKSGTKKIKKKKKAGADGEYEEVLVAVEMSEPELRMKHNIQMSLAAELQDLSTHFRKTQKHYLQKVESRNEKSKSSYSLSRQDTSKKSQNSDFLSGRGEPFGNSSAEADGYDIGFTKAQLHMLDETHRSVEMRSQEIQRIQQSIIELSEIFKELAILVVDQGTILDRIDYNIENTIENVDRAVEELHQAEKYQKKTKVKMCMVLLVVLIIAAIVVLIVKLLLTNI